MNLARELVWLVLAMLGLAQILVTQDVAWFLHRRRIGVTPAWWRQACEAPKPLSKDGHINAPQNKDGGARRSPSYRDDAQGPDDCHRPRQRGPPIGIDSNVPCPG